MKKFPKLLNKGKWTLETHYLKIVLPSTSFSTLSNKKVLRCFVHQCGMGAKSLKRVEKQPTSSNSFTTGISPFDEPSSHPAKPTMENIELRL